MTITCPGKYSDCKFQSGDAITSVVAMIIVFFSEFS